MRVADEHHPRPDLAEEPPAQLPRPAVLRIESDYGMGIVERLLRFGERHAMFGEVGRLLPLIPNESHDACTLPQVS